MMESVLAVGDVSHDISVRIPRFPGADEKVLALETAVGTGGVAANAARAVAQAGVSATLASAIGTDPAGQEIVKDLASSGVD
ncbi:MAG TPA: PfkB family carbohydrate kinase, partial [Thermomicrobiales bacterium]|nr:PfkB family carbohydrate kinase [Thermomicrobiales bacterium]